MARSGNNLNYQPRLIAYAMELKGWDEYETAKQIGITYNSVNAGLAGNLSLKKLRQLADGLGIVWKHLFDLELPESRFRQAVTIDKRV